MTWYVRRFVVDGRCKGIDTWTSANCAALPEGLTVISAMTDAEEVEEIPAEEPVEDREVVVEVEVEEPVIEETPVEVAVETVEEPVVEEVAAPVVEETPAEEPAAEELPRIQLRPNKRDSRAKKASSKMLTPQQETLRAVLLDIIGTRNAVLLNADNEEIGKIQVKELADFVNSSDAPEGIAAVVSDGVIGSRIIDVAAQKNITVLVGKKKGNISKLPDNITVWVKNDLD